MSFRPPHEEGAGRSAAGPPETRDTTHPAERTTAAAKGMALLEEAPRQSLDVMHHAHSVAPAPPLAPPPPPIAPPPAPAPPTLCLDAIAIALTECGDGQAWYTSTAQLQLASLDLFSACRAVPTLHLTVNGDMPDRLRAGPAPSSRVPAFRPRGVTWNLPLSALRGEEDEVFSEVGVLVLGHGLGRVRKGLNRWVDGRVSLPPALRELTFGQWYNRPLHNVAWPARLEKLTFGEAFNRPIDRVSWPLSLRRLTFGLYFDQPICGAAWPCALLELRFGQYFNQPIEGVVWPASLERLTFGLKFNQRVSGVVWPRNLLELTFSRDFAQPLHGVEWPGSLEHLTIAEPVGATLPAWPGVEVHTVWRYWWG